MSDISKWQEEKENQNVGHMFASDSDSDDENDEFLT